MRVRAAHSAGRHRHRLAAGVLAAVCLGAVSGCGGQQQAGGTQRVAGDLRQELAVRARQVAAAWDGSAAAAAWRAGYQPLGALTELPRGGPRSAADARAARAGNFVLRTELPATSPDSGRVTWEKGGSTARQLASAKAVYDALAANSEGASKPHLTVTEVELGTMRMVTNRGPATVPAWLFHLKGYDSPLKRAAVTPTKLPSSPFKGVTNYAGGVDRLVEVSADGRTVTVIALHGACDDGAVVDVRETSGSVVLAGSYKERKTTGFCTKQAKLQQVKVTLERPLGTRVLLSAHTGRPLIAKPLLGTAATVTWR